MDQWKMFSSLTIKAKEEGWKENSGEKHWSDAMFKTS